VKRKREERNPASQRKTAREMKTRVYPEITQREIESMVRNGERGAELPVNE